jgi:hypothetical protein
MLGDTADIDLILIHADQPSTKHEIIRLSDQVHLDIRHHTREIYAKPSELRVDPWLGPAMCEPVFIYDPEHFFERAQAGARGQYYRPDHTHARARAFLTRARQSKAMLNVSTRWIKMYTQAALEAANAAACLTGFPVAGRRLSIDLARTLSELDQLQLYRQFIQLLGGFQEDNVDITELIPTWSLAHARAGEVSSDPEFEPCRQAYYLRGFQALVEDNPPEIILWTLLTTWERAMNTLQRKGESASYLPSWETALDRLKLSTYTSNGRASELEQFLDSIETLIEGWAERVGA